MQICLIINLPFGLKLLAGLYAKLVYIYLYVYYIIYEFIYNGLKIKWPFIIQRKSRRPEMDSYKTCDQQIENLVKWCTGRSVLISPTTAWRELISSTCVRNQETGVLGDGLPVSQPFLVIVYWEIGIPISQMTARQGTIGLPMC